MNQKRTSPVRFDESLPRFASIVRDHLGMEALESHAFLRDATGQLTLILRNAIEDTTRAAITQEVTKQLGSYVGNSAFAVATPEELLDQTLAAPESYEKERISHPEFEGQVWLIDRRIIGQDWLRPNFDQIPNTPPILTFYSCKGGVGRSTALAVTSAALASRGLSILVIDLDLEAPGLGTMLLNVENSPKYGALDYLIENGMDGIDDAFLSECVATSPLTQGRALVDVVPAVGAISRDYPQNVLAKLGRAFLDDPNGQGGAKFFCDQIRTLIRDISIRGRYDAVFVDARAGLSESSASTVIGLGGDILCFGVDMPQTFATFGYLFAHLSRYAQATEPENDWRRRIRMIHAKAKRGVEAQEHFRESARELFEQHFYEEAAPEEDAFNFDFNDENAPHYAWPIPYDADYAEFDPVRKPNQLQKEFFDRSFGPFVDRVEALVRAGNNQA